MKNLFNDSLFLGIVTLQVAAFSLVYVQSWGEDVSWTSLRNSLVGASLQAGNKFPEFPAYDQHGVRQPIVLKKSEESAILIKGTCSCDEITISNWLDSAQKKSQAPTLVIPLDEQEEANAIKRNGWQGRVLRVRRSELERLGLMGQHSQVELPLLAYINSDGVISGVRTR